MTKKTITPAPAFDRPKALVDLKSINPTSEHSAAGRYMLFRRGFRDGAGTLAHRHPLEPDYMRGYEEGIKAAHDVALIFCKEINYDPMTGILS